MGKRWATVCIVLAASAILALGYEARVAAADRRDARVWMERLVNDGVWIDVSGLEPGDRRAAVELFKEVEKAIRALARDRSYSPPR